MQSKNNRYLWSNAQIDDEKNINEDGTLASAISNYLITECGVEKEHIENLKKLCL